MRLDAPPPAQEPAPPPQDPAWWDLACLILAVQDRLVRLTPYTTVAYERPHRQGRCQLVAPKLSHSVTRLVKQRLVADTGGLLDLTDAGFSELYQRMRRQGRVAQLNHLLSR